MHSHSIDWLISPNQITDLNRPWDSIIQNLTERDLPSQIRDPVPTDSEFIVGVIPSQCTHNAECNVLDRVRLPLVSCDAG